MHFITYDVIIESVKKDNGNKYQLSKNNLKKGLDNYNIGSYNESTNLINGLKVSSLSYITCRRGQPLKNSKIKA